MFVSTEILNVKHLKAGYSGNVILDNVTFELGRGEVLAVIGQNGSGKSTLLKTLFGLVPLLSGQVSLKGDNINKLLPQKLLEKGVSFFMQNGLIMPELTVLEHLKLASLHNGSPDNSLTTEDIFKQFHVLREMRDRKAGNLSGGERQILSFSIMQMQNAKTWLLDEPTAGLAPEMVEYTTGFLQEKNKEGITMLIVEHNMDVAFRLASHIVVAKDGRLTRKFNKQEFLQEDFLDKQVYN